MAAVLLFLLVVFVIAGWWLSHQGITSKPWLEVGPDPTGEYEERFHYPKIKIGLGVFLTVVGAIFALFASGYFMRMEYPDWRSMPLPPIVWINTGLLVMASISLQGALNDSRSSEFGNSNIWITIAGVATLGFLGGQLIAWQQLDVSGYGLTANPANSFFYMITAVHGLHILGGMLVLGRTAWAVHAGAAPEKQRLSLELCATYWHFLLFVWLIMLVVLVGWANDLFDICSQLLLEGLNK